MHVDLREVPFSWDFKNGTFSLGVQIEKCILWQEQFQLFCHLCVFRWMCDVISNLCIGTTKTSVVKKDSYKQLGIRLNHTCTLSTKQQIFIEGATFASSTTWWVKMNAQLISCYKIQGRPRQNSKSQFLSSQHWDYFYCATENGAKSISTTTDSFFR